MDLRYLDLANGLDLSASFTFNDGKRTDAWTIATHDPHLTTFSQRTTYVLPDGTQQQGTWTDETVPRVIVPAYRAAPA